MGFFKCGLKSNFTNFKSNFELHIAFSTKKVPSSLRQIYLKKIYKFFIFIWQFVNAFIKSIYFQGYNQTFSSVQYLFSGIYCTLENVWSVIQLFRVVRPRASHHPTLLRKKVPQEYSSNDSVVIINLHLLVLSWSIFRNKGI